MFDPFKDFDTAGYLRNSAREKNPDIVKQIEHDLFTANVQDAMDYLKRKRNISYGDFLQVHHILFSGLYPWAGFSIDWSKTDKVTYLSALSAEIQSPGKGILDGYLKNFIDDPQDPKIWEAAIQSIKGLDGRVMADTVEGTFNDPSVLQKYREFDQQRGYEIVPHSGLA